MSQPIEGRPETSTSPNADLELPLPSSFAITVEMDLIDLALKRESGVKGTGKEHFYRGAIKGIGESLTGRDRTVWVRSRIVVVQALAMAEEDLIRATESNIPSDFVAGRIAGLEWVLGQRSRLVEISGDVPSFGEVKKERVL